MDDKKYALLGVFAPIAAYAFIGLSILSSPWFSWWENALSDLGHSAKSPAAPLFNFGLLLAGFLTLIYAVESMIKHARYTGYSLLAAGFLLQLVGAFNEVYGGLHLVVSILLFISLGFASVMYFIERRSRLAVIAFIVGLGSWVFYWIRVYNAGIAVPETISSTAVALWVMKSALGDFTAGEKRGKET